MIRVEIPSAIYSYRFHFRHIFLMDGIHLVAVFAVPGRCVGVVVSRSRACCVSLGSVKEQAYRIDGPVSKKQTSVGRLIAFSI